MKNQMRVVILSVILAVGAALMSGCQGSGQQNISPYSPYSPYTTSCVAGQVGCVATTCAPGTVGCVATTGYYQYEGTLAGVNGSLANSIVSQMFGVSNYCIGGCYNYSYVNVVVSNGVAQVTISLGGYPISGQGTINPINNNTGTDVQVYAFGSSGRFDIVSNNMALNGTTTAVPSVVIQYNGQQFATSSLILQAL